LRPGHHEFEGSHADRHGTWVHEGRRYPSHSQVGAPASGRAAPGDLAGGRPRKEGRPQCAAKSRASGRSTSAERSSANIPRGRESVAMRRAVVAVALICSLVGSLLWASPVQAESLKGKVQTPDGTPIAGLMVYLVHQNLGRSTPILTASDGTFVILNVPSVAD